ncbi:MAG: hypothetical protein HQ483_18290 [Rhodospirillales bacterium]|nr:hypothetical protein [Rhodospirillales bacterium]
MALEIHNADEAGMTLRAVTTAQYILQLLDQAEIETQGLESLHWYGDLPDLQDARDTLTDDIAAHETALQCWNGNITIQPIPGLQPQDQADEHLTHPLHDPCGTGTARALDQCPLQGRRAGK